MVSFISDEVVPCLTMLLVFVSSSAGVEEELSPVNQEHTEAKKQHVQEIEEDLCRPYGEIQGRGNAGGTKKMPWH